MHKVGTVQQAIQIHMYIYTYLQTQMYMYIHIHMHAVAQSWSKTAGNAQRRHHSKRSQEAETLSLRYCYGGKGAQIMGTRHVGVVARQVSWYIARTTFVVSHRKLLRDFSRCVSPTHFVASDETCLNTTFSWMIYMITPWHAHSCTTSYWLIHIYIYIYTYIYIFIYMWHSKEDTHVLRVSHDSFWLTSPWHIRLPRHTASWHEPLLRDITHSSATCPLTEEMRLEIFGPPD